MLAEWALFATSPLLKEGLLRRDAASDRSVWWEDERLIERSLAPRAAEARNALADMPGSDTEPGMPVLAESVQCWPSPAGA